MGHVREGRGPFLRRVITRHVSQFARDREADDSFRINPSEECARAKHLKIKLALVIECIVEHMIERGELSTRSTYPRTIHFARVVDDGLYVALNGPSGSAMALQHMT
jgi:hypothetical protein